MTHRPPFGTPEYQEYFRNEQEKHNTSMEVLKKVCEEYQRISSNQLAIDLKKFNNQVLQKWIAELQKTFNEGIESFQEKIDDLSEKYWQWHSTAKMLNFSTLEKQIQTHIEVHINTCKFLFKNSNQSVDMDLIKEIETIGNNLIAYAESKKWE